MMNWIISSSVLILVVIALRFFLKGKISLRLQYGLWALVLVRLLFPFSVGETVVSLGNWMEQAADTKEVQQVLELTQTPLPSMSYEAAYDVVAEEYEKQGVDIDKIPIEEFSENVEYEVLETMNSDYSAIDILKMVWIAGMVILSGWFIFTNIHFFRKIKQNRVLLENVGHLGVDRPPVYKTDVVETPCLYGLFHPSIYVTSEVLEQENCLPHVLEHERTHYRHKDHIWSVFRAVCLILHWYNPLVWCAAILSRNDAELACDEATIKRLGEEERAAYGRTLIGLTCEKRPAVLLTATTMTGSGKSIKERITLIAKKPKMATITLVVVVLLAMIAVGVTYTGAKLQYASFSEWADTLNPEELQYFEFLKGNASEKRYYLPTNEEFAQFCELLQSIPEEDCYRRKETVDVYEDYMVWFLCGENEVLLKCLEDETVLYVGSTEMPEFAPEGKVLIIDSPELWNYIVDTVDEKGCPYMSVNSALEEITNGTGRVYMMLHDKEGKLYETFLIQNGGYDDGRLSYLIDCYEWEKIENPDVSSSNFCVSLEKSDTMGTDDVHRLTVWDVDAGILRYEADGYTYYWKAISKDSIYTSIYDDVRHLYDNLEVSECNFEFVDYMNDYDYVAKKIIYEIYREFVMNLSPTNQYKIYDYTVIRWERSEYNEHGNTITGWFEYAFRPANTESSAIYAGNVTEGTGEYEGMLIARRYFTVEEIDEDYWMGYVHANE